MSEAFRLSILQSNVWQFRDQLMKDCGQMVVKIDGQLDVQRLEQTLEALLPEYEIFATRFRKIEGIDNPVQVLGECIIDWQVCEVNGIDGIGQFLANLKSECLFELNSESDDEPSVKARLVSVSAASPQKNTHILALHFHPMCLDGDSIQLLAAAIVRAYGDIDAELENIEQQEMLQYIDASEYQYELLESDDVEDGRLFWQNLGWNHDYYQHLLIEKPRFYRDKQDLAPQIQLYQLGLDDELTAKLKHLAAEYDTGMEQLLFVVYQHLLLRLADSDRLVVGRNFKGRVDEETAAVVGILNRYLPMAIERNQASLAELLEQNSQLEDDLDSWQECFEWRYFLKLADRTDEIDKQRCYFPLSFDWCELADTATSGGVSFEHLAHHSFNDYFHLLLSAQWHSSDEQLTLCFYYEQQYFDKNIVVRLAEQFVCLLAEVLDNPAKELSALNLLPEHQVKQVIDDFNAQDSIDPYAPCAHQMIEIQAAKTPKALALKCESVELSYHQVNGLANAYAEQLQLLGVSKGDFVGVYSARSVESVLAIIAIFKLGGVYVPLDPDYPELRITYMMEHSGLKVVMASEHLQANLAAQNVALLTLDLPHENLQETNLDITVDSTDGAYLIYTSGSTGLPKGTVISHDALSYHSASAASYFQLDSEDRVLLFAPFNFDPSIEQCIPALISGATVVVRPAQTWDAASIAEHVQRLGLTVMNFPTSYWHLLVNEWQKLIERGEDLGQLCKTLRIVISGGDKMLTDAVKRWQQFGLAQVRLLNGYGPTETTVTACFGEDFSDSLGVYDQLTIGRALPNRRLYVLDQYLRPQPIGVVGQLCIGGKGVATGYLHDAEQTAQNFVDDPFSRDGSKVYLTGDRVFYGTDGQLYFLGRNDTQVKIRGFRIEPLEVEQSLNQCQLVKEAAVAIKTVKDSKQLVACYVSNDGAVVDEILKDYLAECLPEYMVPSIYMYCEQLPLLPSGKLDRNQLTKLATDFQPHQKVHVPANSETEKALAAIWVDVLDIERVSLTDNFLDLGGHSLLTMRLSALIREHFHVAFSLADVFAAKDLAALAIMVDNADTEDVEPELPLVAIDKSNPVPVSYAQEALWLLDSLGQKLQYKLTGMIRVPKPLDLTKVQEAVNRLIARHDSLRTRFVEVDGKPMQQVLPTADCAIEVRDMAMDSPQTDADKQEISGIIESWAEQSFDLSTAPLMRMFMLCFKDGAQQLVLSVHHIISDGLSTPLLLRDFSAIYDELTTGKAANLPVLDIQYPDYAHWQRKVLDSNSAERDIDYWRNKLDGHENLSIGDLNPNQKALSGRGCNLKVEIDSQVDSDVLAVCQKLNVSPTSCFISMVYLVLDRFSATSDFCIGMATATRDRVELENVVGMLLNTLVLKFDANDRQKPLSEFLQQGQSTIREAVIHQLPFEMIVDALKPQRSLNVNPFFQTTVTYFDSDKRLNIDGQSLLLESAENNSSNFELSFDFSRDPQGKLTLLVEYSTDLFSNHYINQLLECIVHVLSQVPAALNKPLALLDYVNNRAEILDLACPETTPMPDEHLLIALDKRIKSYGDNPYLTFADSHLTFAEAHQRASAIALQLQQKGVGSGDFVAVSLERGINSTLAAIGVMMIGAVYVPFDTNWPEARIEYIFNDCVVVAAVTDEYRLPILSNLITSKVQSVVLDSNGDFLQGYQGQVNIVDLPQDAPAYVLYTSGTTGQPKGVVISYRALASLLVSMPDRIGFNADSLMLAVPNMSFDMSIPDIFFPLWCGARVEIASQNQVTYVDQLVQHIDKVAPTHMQSTPVMWQMLFDCGWQNRTNTIMVFGGEAPSTKLINYVEKYQCTAINGYGPTETAVYSHMNQIKTGVPINIGQALANYESYIIDPQLNLLPLGVVGELYIGGPALANGYHNKQELTHNSFIDNPFGKGRIYKTGDLAHWQFIEGQYQLVCDGRVDEQIKLRGFRIELSEIETAFSRIPGVVRVAVVVNRSEGQPDQLVAFYVSEDVATDIDGQVIRTELAKSLPNYMIPTRFEHLEDLPLNSNQKVDKKRLSQLFLAPIELQSADGSDEQLSSTEQSLLEIWCQIFGHNNISVEDNFFDLGGHSLLFVELQLKFSQLYDIDLSMAKLFNSPVLRQMAALVDDAIGSGATGVAPINPDVTPPQAQLSYNQYGMWLSDNVANGSTAYNMVFAMGIKAAVEQQLVIQSMDILLQRHQVLRTRFVYEQQQALQEVIESRFDALDHIDCTQLCAEDAKARVNQCLQRESSRLFNLANGELWHISLMQMAAEDFVLILNLHHVCADGWSIRILIQEFGQIYQDLSQGREPDLPQLPVQYIDYAHWQRQSLADGLFDTQLSYWQQLLQGCKGITHLPLDKPRLGEQGASPSTDLPVAAGIAVLFSEQQCQRYRTYMQGRNGSLYHLFLAAYQLLLAMETDQTDIVIGTDVVNRNRPELANVVGFLTTQLPVRTVIDMQMSVDDYLDGVTTQARNLLANADIPFDYLISQLEQERQEGLLPLFQSKFYMDVVPAKMLQGEQGAFEFQPIEIEQFAYRTDLSLGLTDDESEVKGHWVYNAQLFEPKSIERLAQHFNQLLEVLVAESEVTLGQLIEKLTTQNQQQQQAKQQALMAQKVKGFKGRRRS